MPSHTTCMDNPATASKSVRMADIAHRALLLELEGLTIPVQVGDTVLIKDRHPGRKFRLQFEADPWTVIAVNGTMVTAKRGAENVTGNISQFKRFSVAYTLVRNGEGSTVAEDLCDPGDIHPRPDASGTPEHLAVEGEAASPQRLLGPSWPEPSSTSGSPRQPAGRSGGGRYHLRHNPSPSRRYADFVSD
ncbi:hypothetical protein NDU88_001691 [Pleurodeles waltl]|uniref:Uncharacterized protein n=1 Tax=Pleurodeles waltl TaxID=8319 RepID=A0AAV7W172_PLEWA|nr:hypothetical protein NDU88_001691 [Pleurodeles waltl]